MVWIICGVLGGLVRHANGIALNRRVHFSAESSGATFFVWVLRLHPAFFSLAITSFVVFFAGLAEKPYDAQAVIFRRFELVRGC